MRSDFSVNILKGRPSRRRQKKQTVSLEICVSSPQENLQLLIVFIDKIRKK